MYGISLQAVVIDTTRLTPRESISRVLQLAAERGIT